MSSKTLLQIHGEPCRAVGTLKLDRRGSGVVLTYQDPEGRTWDLITMTICPYDEKLAFVLEPGVSEQYVHANKFGCIQFTA